MNGTFLRNLTDAEFLKQISPSTDLEHMLVARLEAPDADPDWCDELEARAEAAEEECKEAETKAEEAISDLDDLREYAIKLHAALAIAEPESVLLDSEDYEMLRA